MHRPATRRHGPFPFAWPHPSRARAFAASLALAICLALQAASATAEGGAAEMFTVDVDRAGIERLMRAGYDVAAIRETAGGYAVDLVLWPHERARLAAEGRAPLLWRGPGGKSAGVLAAQQADEGYKVWRSYDEPGGYKDRAYDIAKTYPRLVKLEVIGFSAQDRPIIALKVTKDAASTRDGSRPAVLTIALQHAREWIGPELAWRQIKRLVEGYGKDEGVTRLVDSRELWFVLVANPDGYQHTFTPGNRLWRKTMRDNNGDGKWDPNDGVDPNRNYPQHWGYDEEGSGSAPSSWTYRGPAPASEPETQAMIGLLQRVPFSFMVNYHSVANLILYGLGWQVETVSADQPIYAALAGTPARPAIDGFKPQLSARLYTTNGETCDYAITTAKVTCFTPELSDGGSGGGFIFPDDEALVQQEFERNLPFALDLAESAADPAHPVSHLGNSVQPFYLDPFAVSYGDPQPVQVNAARHLGEVSLHYRIGDGIEQVVPTTEWQGGERYGGAGDLHYRRVRGQVSGARTGDRVTVWYEAGGARSEPFSYTLASDTGARVLILAAEDYTGAFPTANRTDGPSHLAAHLDALAANGLAADVYDIDARARVAPHPLGVLGHYDAVLWYTGDDMVTAMDGMPSGTASRLAHDTVMAVRDYLNEGGKLVYAGQWAGAQYNDGLLFDADQDLPCGPEHPEANCIPLSNDFLQYYLGAYSYGHKARPSQTRPNRAGEGGGWWSDSGDQLDNSARRTFDLSAAQAPIVFAFDAVWQTEDDYDFGYVEASLDGAQWTPLPDMDGRTVVSKVEGDANIGPGIEGTGQARLRYDLSAYKGQTVHLRLRYLTDYAWVMPGWWVDNLSLDGANGSLYADTLDGNGHGWTLDGWRTLPETVPAVAVEDAQGGGPTLGGLHWTFARSGAAAPVHSAAFNSTRSVLPAATYPQFDSRIEAQWASDGAYEGDHMVHSGQAGAGYLRLMRSFDLTAARTAELSFRVNYDAPPPWNAIFVEAHTVGQDDWTTLPDRNGHTRSTTVLGACRMAEWLTGHPHLSHFLTRQDQARPPACLPSGRTGTWNAASGTSAGWEEWSVDLGAFAGREVEVSISYVTGSQSMGVRLDTVTVPAGAPTSFEADLGGWRVAGAPDGSPPNVIDFQRVAAAAVPVGAVVSTPNTVYLGFGIEGIERAEDRAAVMGRMIAYLLPQHRLFVPLTLRGEAWR